MSTTSTAPDAVTATPQGQRNCPSADPRLPKAPTKLKDYLREALKQHMVEALLAPDPLADDEATAWLDSSDDVIGSISVSSAAIALGPERVLVLARGLEAAGDTFRAAKRFASAALTPELNALAGGIGGGKDSPPTVAIMKSVALLQGGAQSVKSRTLEVPLRGIMVLQLPFADPWLLASQSRVCELVDQGVDLQSPEQILNMAVSMATCMAFEPMGWNKHGAGNWKLEAKVLAATRVWTSMTDLAHQACGMFSPSQSRYWVARALPVASLALGSNWSTMEQGWQERTLPHRELEHIIETYDFGTHYKSTKKFSFGFDFTLVSDPGLAALYCYGDLRLARRWKEQLLRSIAPQLAARGCEEFGALSHVFVMGMVVINGARPICRQAGLAQQSRQINKVLGFTSQTARSFGAQYASLTNEKWGFSRIIWSTLIGTV